MYKGIDVSDNQGVIDWAAVQGAGCRFAILRSVRGSGRTDNQFAANVHGCQKEGIPFEVYRYTYALSPTAALEEAGQVIRLLKAYGLSCRIWWDVEDSSLLRLGKGVLTGLIQTALDAVTNAGYEFGIYTSEGFYNAGYFDTTAFTCPMWIARYPYSQYYTFSQEPPPDRFKPVTGQPLFGWQYTSKGRMNGIVGAVDLDLCYLPFWEEKAAPETPAADGSLWANVAGLSYNKEAAAANEAFLAQHGIITHLFKVKILGS